MTDPLGPEHADAGVFPTTHWSLVVQARSLASAEARAALAELCSLYWYPLYAFIRRKGNDADKALDLTQGYFTQLLAKAKIAEVDQSKGRFRAFLRTDCQHFLVDQHRRSTARGGGIPLISIDAHDAESRYRIEPTDHRTPDHLFDRAWALTLLNKVLRLLADEYARSDRTLTFERLKGVLTQGKLALPVATLAAEFATTEAAVHTAVHRLRQRYRRILEAQIAATIDDPSELDAEIRWLFEAVRS
jgi:DNA-directed RNA polymerase specialized sigma24 family protein